jgi:hypothetical protein
MAGFIAGKAITVILLIPVVLYIIMLSVVQAALQGIFQAALYQYAIKGEPPRGFDRETLNEAITPRAFG